MSSRKALVVLMALAAAPALAGASSCEGLSVSGVVSADEPFSRALGDDLVLRIALEDGGWRVSMRGADDAPLVVRRAPTGIAPVAVPDGPVTERYFFGRAAVDPVLNPALIVPGAMPGPPPPQGTLTLFMPDSGASPLRFEACVIREAG